MKAFIGHPFGEEQSQLILIQKIRTHIEAHDIECVDAKRVQSKSVDEKVTELILGCDIFVGIFTRDKLICPGEKCKLCFDPRKKDRSYVTSDWVIQELGFAIGTKRHLILLKENGVRDLPKLQGNIEYIPFEGSSIEECFTKLSQIIGDIKLKITGGVAAAAIAPEKSEQADVAMPEEKDSEPEEGMEEEKRKVTTKIFEALYIDEDYAKAQRIFDEEAKTVSEGDELIRWRATVLRQSHSLGDDGAFDKLKKIVEDNEDNTGAIKQLAHLYKMMGVPNKAKEYFLIAAGKYDAADTKENLGYIDANVQVARCLADDDDLNAALSMLRKLLSDSNLQDPKAHIFKAMAEICKDKDDIERFFVYAEAALDIDPFDTNLRFKLAYAYSDNNEDQLALLHYKILTANTTTHKFGWNNLGAKYGDLDMHTKSIRSYCKSADLNVTLAMANLAQKYLKEGFVEKAKELINKANALGKEGVEIDHRVGEAQKSLNDLIEADNKKEKEILREAEKQRKFRVNYATAFCSDKAVSKNQIEGIWETPWGNGELNFDEDTKAFSITIQKEEPVGPITSLLGATEGTKITRTTNIEGTIEGVSGKYSVEINKGQKAPSLLTGLPDVTGHLMLTEDLNNISVMEKTKDSKIEFKQWTKQPAASSPS